MCAENQHVDVKYFNVIKFLTLRVTSLEVFQGTEIPACPSTSNEGIVDEVSVFGMRQLR